MASQSLMEFEKPKAKLKKHTTKLKSLATFFHATIYHATLSNHINFAILLCYTLEVVYSF